MAHPAQRRWYPLVFVIASLVLLPLSVLLLSWQSIDTQIWSHLWDTQMPRLLGNTLTLIAGVGVGVTLLGVSLAWLTSLCEFPGRRWLDWALMLPFAIPAYVLAFVFVGLLDFAGPIQTLLREWFGMGLRLPRVRSTGGVIIVLILVFYPYVYLLARTAFLAQGKGLMEAARVLRLDDLTVFVRTADRGSLSAAARELEISPALASAAVKRLEGELGLRLFARTTRSLRLTEEGEHYLRHAREALRLLKEGHDALIEGQQTLGGTLKISMPSDLGRNMLVGWLETEGRSTTVITSTLPSRPSWIS